MGRSSIPRQREGRGHGHSSKLSFGFDVRGAYVRVQSGVGCRIRTRGDAVIRSLQGRGGGGGEGGRTF
jgi:hypothetical protein